MRAHHLRGVLLIIGDVKRSNKFFMQLQTKHVLFDGHKGTRHAQTMLNAYYYIT